MHGFPVYNSATVTKNSKPSLCGVVTAIFFYHCLTVLYINTFCPP